MIRMFLTGASGFLGWNFCRLFAKEWEIFACYNNHRVSIENVLACRVDISDFTELKEAFTTIKPDIVLHTAAASQPNWCQENPTASKKINLDATINLAGLCADASIPFIFTSTDLVFDGLNPPYNEKSSVSPLNLYAEQKTLAEEKIRASLNSYLICRMPLMFGYPGPAANNFIQYFFNEMSKGEKLKLFSDEYRTPVSVLTACKGLKLMIGRFAGTIHLGGIERASRYELGLLMKDVFGFKTALIEPCSHDDIPMPAKRPLDVSLDSSLAFSVGYDPLPLRKQMEEIENSKKFNRE